MDIYGKIIDLFYILFCYFIFCIDTILCSIIFLIDFSLKSCSKIYNYIFHRDGIWLGNTNMLYVEYGYGRIYSFKGMLDLTFYDHFQWFKDKFGDIDE
jgi:hypothetical protein